MDIIKATVDDVEELALIVSKSNKDVAVRFSLTFENAPKHPSFCTREWVMADMARGEIYFICREGGIAKGCVAYEQPDKDTAYLNRLSVLPEYRRNGTGAALVRHILDYSCEKGVKKVSIGIIAEFSELKSWYEKFGFVDVGDKTFAHLPFTVKYMEYKP